MNVKLFAISILCASAIITSTGAAMAQNEPLATSAQKVVSVAEPIRVEATIIGIDAANRTLMVRGPRGDATVLVNKELSEEVDRLADMAIDESDRGGTFGQSQRGILVGDPVEAEMAGEFILVHHRQQQILVHARILPLDASAGTRVAASDIPGGAFPVLNCPVRRR